MFEGLKRVTQEDHALAKRVGSCLRIEGCSYCNLFNQYPLVIDMLKCDLGFRVVGCEHFLIIYQDFARQE